MKRVRVRLPKPLLLHEGIKQPRKLEPGDVLPRGAVRLARAGYLLKKGGHRTYDQDIQVLEDVDGTQYHFHRWYDYFEYTYVNQVSSIGWIPRKGTDVWIRQS